MGATKRKSNSGAQNIPLKLDDEVVFDPTKTSNIFKTFFSEISKNLLEKLPDPPNKFNINSVSEYYKFLNLKNKFNFSRVSEETVHKIVHNFDVKKAAGIDNVFSCLS